MKLSDLAPDERNANKGTAAGQKAIVNSIQRSGAGRSIVVDKNNHIIGGNKTSEAIAEVYDADAEVIVIESEGEKLVVHKRNDLDLSDPDPNNPARQLAYADNMTSWASFDLDPDVVMADIEAGFNFEAIDISLSDLDSLTKWEANFSPSSNSPPSLDDLESEYGQEKDRDFWPFIRVQVSPETKELFDSLMAQLPGEDEAIKTAQLLKAVNLALV